jgi:hypothetical protein
VTDTDFDLDDEPVLTAEGEVAAAICGHQGTADAPVKRLGARAGRGSSRPEIKRTGPGSCSIRSRNARQAGARSEGVVPRNFARK